jgi:Ca2+-binding EF-hand superfamily protein
MAKNMFIFFTNLSILKNNRMMEELDGTGHIHTEEKMKEAFQAMDADKNGFISAADIITVMKGLGEDVPAEEVLDMIRDGDLDGDGVVGFEDFCKFLLLIQ